MHHCVTSAATTMFARKIISNTTICNGQRGIVTSSLENGVQRITMHDAKTRNSLSVKMMENLIETIKQHETNKNARAIVLAGEGPVFSAGHNLKEFAGGISAQKKVFELAKNLMYTLIDSPLPVIARVDGLAAAAGCQLVAQCDLAFCTEKSAFSTPGANFGIFCSTPGVALARSMHHKAAMKMLLSGTAISSQEAEANGLVNKVLANSIDLDNEINTVCQQIMGKSRSVVELGKKFYYKQINVDIRKAYEMGGNVMVDNLQLDDGREGVQSFMEKRKPVWSQ